MGTKTLPRSPFWKSRRVMGRQVMRGGEERDGEKVEAL